MTSSTPPPTGSQGSGFSEQPVGDPVQSCPLPELLVDGVDEEPPQIEVEGEAEEPAQLEFVGEVEDLAQLEIALDAPLPTKSAEPTVEVVEPTPVVVEPEPQPQPQAEPEPQPPPKKVVQAKAGDCLCGIAVEAGLADCQPLRDLPENADFLDRDLADGDEVTLPEGAEPGSAATGSPPFHIRFVHGSPSQPHREDAETTTLHVSNFVPNLGGADGLQPFPTDFGFHDDGHQDPDAFKVEVWDPAAGGAVTVKLEAEKPIYTAGSGGKLTATSFTPFTGEGRVMDALDCNVVSDTTTNTFRSKYLRLVVDEIDRDAPEVPGQLLFVSDIADGLGTGAADDNDSVEILDQRVRATYEIARCPGPRKCKVTKSVDIGGAERKRVRVHFHLFRSSPGGTDTHFGVSTADVQKHLRRRTFKWYRRVFAQADLAPRLVSLNVLDPPQENMLCLSHGPGRAVAAGGSIKFQIATNTRNVPFELVFAETKTPVEAGGMIAAAMPPGFTAQALKSTRATTAANHSCDVLIKADNGERVTILSPQMSPGAQMTVAVPRLDFENISDQDAALDGSVSWVTMDTKRILREVPVAEDAMHCIVIGGFDRKTLRGLAYLDCLGADAPFRPDLPFRSGTIMAYKARAPILDNGDSQPFTSPHESVHTLTDLIHTKKGAPHDRNQLLANNTSADNAIGATKRLCDGPFQVKMEKNGTTTMTIVDVKLVEVMRRHGAPKLEDW